MWELILQILLATGGVTAISRSYLEMAESFTKLQGKVEENLIELEELGKRLDSIDAKLGQHSRYFDRRMRTVEFWVVKSDASFTPYVGEDSATPLIDH